jgi:drug/metabolite transporter (DMT)-like permease
MQMDTAALTFWMLVVTTVALFLLSAVFETSRWAWPNREALWAIAYSAVIVVGLGNIAWFALARRLPPVVSGLSSMLIPVVGVFMSIQMVHEQPTLRDWWALALVALALLSTVVPRPRR